MPDRRHSEIADLRRQVDRLLEEVRGVQDRIAALEQESAVEPEQQGRRVLICDDTRLVRALIRGVLAADGFHVVEAEDGQEALDILQEQNFDCVIADIHMPGVDGAALLKGIRVAQNNVDIPVIVCSGSRERRDYLSVIQYGVQGVLQKPIKKKELLDCVNEVLAAADRKAAAGHLDVFDPDSALNRVGGDAELLNELLSDFLKESPALLANVRRPVETGQPGETADAAHSLKGALASISAGAAASAAERLERIGREGDMTEAHRAYDDLEQKAHGLREVLEDFLKSS